MPSNFYFIPRTPPPVRSARQIALAQWKGWDFAPAEKAAVLSARQSGNVMPGVLKSLKLDHRLCEAEVLKVWTSQMDPAVTAHARPAGLVKGTLFINVDSNVWLDEIVRYRRREILERLQNSFGSTVVARISFRIG
jgi:hypothetical protein